MFKFKNITYNRIKNVKYFKIHLAKDMHVLYTENYKILLKELKRPK